MNNMKFSHVSVWALGLWVLFPMVFFCIFGIAHALLLYLEMLLNNKDTENQTSSYLVIKTPFKLFMLPCLGEGEIILIWHAVL